MTLKLLKVVLIVISLLPSFVFAAQTAPSPPVKITNAKPLENISSLLQPMMVVYDIPGMAALVIHNNEIVGAGAVGVRKRGTQNKIDVHDIFHIGSDTKSMTATIAAFLVEQGLLRWDTKVVEVFPELKNNINPAYKYLTLSQLLTHRGGVIPDIDYDTVQKNANNNLVKARQLAMEIALSQPPTFSRGTFNYSNMGYIIAGHMEEKVAAKSWEKLMQEFLFHPLQMTTAGFGPPSNANDQRQPVGHNEKGVPVTPAEYGDNPAMMGPAGTVHVSIFDWAKYINFHLRGAEGKAEGLTLNSFKKLHTPISNPPPPYAMGWIVTDMDWANGPVLTHAGSNELWYAKVWIAPKKDFAILVTANQGGDKVKAAVNAAGLALVKHFLNLKNIKAIDTSH